MYQQYIYFFCAGIVTVGCKSIAIVQNSCHPVFLVFYSGGPHLKTKSETSESSKLAKNPIAVRSIFNEIYSIRAEVSIKKATFTKQYDPFVQYDFV
jgi:hypothetical protein